MADRLESWYGRAALSVLVYAQRLERTQRQEKAAALWYSPKTERKTK